MAAILSRPQCVKRRLEHVIGGVALTRQILTCNLSRDLTRPYNSSFGFLQRGHTADDMTSRHVYYRLTHFCLSRWLLSNTKSIILMNLQIPRVPSKALYRWYTRFVHMKTPLMPCSLPIVALHAFQLFIYRYIPRGCTNVGLPGEHNDAIISLRSSEVEHCHV